MLHELSGFQKYVSNHSYWKYSSYHLRLYTCFLFQPKRILGKGLCARGGSFNFSRRFANFEISEFCNMRHIIRKLLKSTLFCIKAICWKLFVEKLLGFKVFQKWVIESKWAICSYQSHWDVSLSWRYFFQASIFTLTW